MLNAVASHHGPIEGHRSQTLEAICLQHANTLDARLGEPSPGAVKAYYQQRAPEYDQWYLGTGRYALMERPGWDDELAVADRDAAHDAARDEPSTSPAAPGF